MAKSQQNSNEIIADAIAWVAHNYDAVVSYDNNGLPLVDVSKAETPPPPLGEAYLRHYAVRDPKSFFKEMLPKHLGGEEEIDVELLEAEKKSLSEVRGVLERYRNVEAESRFAKINLREEAEAFVLGLGLGNDRVEECEALISSLLKRVMKVR